MNHKIGNSIKDKIDVRALTIVLILTLHEFELFTVAKPLASIAGPDIWICIILGNIILSGITYLLVKLAQRFPDQNLYQLSQQILGKPLTYLIGLGYIFFWFTFSTILFKNFSITNQILFLRETPTFIPMTLLAVGIYWLIGYGISAVIRFFQLMLPFFLLPLFFIFSLGFIEINFQFFQPVLADGIMPIIKGTILYVGVFQGIELILFLGPFIENKEKMGRYTLLGLNIVGINIFIFNILSIGVLGVNNIKAAIWPGLDTAATITLPGFLTERYELFLNFPWLIGIFTTLILYAYLICNGVIELFHFKNHKLVFCGVLIFILMGTYLIPNMAWLVLLRNNLSLFTLIFTAVVPILLFVVAKIRGIKGAVYDE